MSTFTTSSPSSNVRRGDFLSEEHAHEMAVLRFVAVRRGLVRHDRHQPDLGVLLLDQILARLAAHGAREEQLEPAVERIPRHRILGPEQLRGQSQARRRRSSTTSTLRRSRCVRRPSRTRSSCSRNPPTDASSSRRRVPIVFGSCLPYSGRDHLRLAMCAVMRIGRTVDNRRPAS